MGIEHVAGGWQDPPREFSVMPFWFWNDALSEEEIVRQIADFRSHGVYGFVIHPRVGLPRDTGWMSDRLLHFQEVAIGEAERHGMYVVLYDEGMYPSGSSSGQVVAENPAFACRGLACRELTGDEKPALSEDERLVAVVRRETGGGRVAIVDRASGSHIRGLHYIGEGPKEDQPPAADILNPEAVRAFIRLVYDRFAERFSRHFGKTIRAIFTDEPSLLARGGTKGMRPGTTGILAHVNRILGYNFEPHLPALWFDDEPAAERRRADYTRALNLRLEETYYALLYDWCESHGLALTGHPHRPDAIGALRYFHVPGQDLVWRWVLPNTPSALEGAESTQAKCSSSAMIHLGRRRNANECCGAYGHELTWDEMIWLARWCFVRGVNQLHPHAFYYSVRGPRREERPPDVGPNSPWWDCYRVHADACRRLSWLNTDARHVCSIAILGRSDRLPWAAAKVCSRHQRDFNYLEERHLFEDARTDEQGIRLGEMHYRALIYEEEPDPRTIEALEPLANAGRLIRFHEGVSENSLIARLDALAPPRARVEPASQPDLRIRHVVKWDADHFILFNEGETPIEFRLRLDWKGARDLLDPETGIERPLAADATIRLDRYGLTVVRVTP
ncbi:hypothetical protein JW916_04670 [Candidatus Sumerlaeota bacterium]|nr:hypothetical protein [Candidatus Sumerlaeota bacterium]